MTPTKVFRPNHTISVGNADSLFERLGLVSHNKRTLTDEIRRGFSVKVIAATAKELDVTQDTLLKVINVSSATLTRRLHGKKRLNPLESDRIYRVVNAFQSVVHLFEGNKNDARYWLNQPAKALRGSTPFQYLDTKAGAEEIQDLIGRLEHGVIS